VKAPPVIGGRSVGLIVTALASAAATLVIFLFNPVQYGFYPRCFFKMTTGMDCAGCGGLRATHQILHGNVGAAFQLNPLLFYAGPIAALLLLNIATEALTGKQLLRGKVVPILLWTLLAAAIVFTIWRNMPPS
jgi:hypothetical protein